MTDFIRFPRTPHLAWSGGTKPRDDKVMSPEAVASFLASPVVVEEKVDGANLGLSLADDVLRVQHRGDLVDLAMDRDYPRLAGWLEEHGREIASIIGPNLVIFGEWCVLRHSVPYDALPDWFLAFDVYDRNHRRFLASDRRDALIERIGLVSVPSVSAGCFTIASLRALIGESRLGPSMMEGVVLRREANGWLEARAKLVRPDFLPADATHWRARRRITNRLATVSKAAV